MTSLAARLVRMLIAAGYEWPGGEKNARIRRTHAGHWQRSRGAWSWWLEPIDRTGFTGATSAGSQWPASVVVRDHFVPDTGHEGDIHFDPPDGWIACERPATAAPDRSHLTLDAAHYARITAMLTKEKQ